MPIVHGGFLLALNLSHGLLETAPGYPPSAACAIRGSVPAAGGIAVGLAGMQLGADGEDATVELPRLEAASASTTTAVMAIQDPFLPTFMLAVLSRTQSRVPALGADHPATRHHSAMNPFH